MRNVIFYIFIWESNMQNRERYSQDNLILSDFCTKSNKKNYYFKVKDDEDSVQIETSDINRWNQLQHINSVIKDIFLPKGYPNSVSCDYLEYQIWDTCQAFCSSICGALTVRAVMEGIGVGSQAASPISAALTWIMKDGTGMLGSILFAWSKGSKLDSDCKKWRLFADILNDIALFIELLIPKMINYSFHMLCAATVFKAMVGTAGSSTRAALITHQAIKGNIADVSAKDGSQELFTNFFAFIFGIFLLKNVTETHHIWLVMCTAALLHLIFNYKAVRCLKMNVFNSERLRLSLRTYLPTSSVPTVEQVNRRESVLLGLGTNDSKLCGFTVVFGASLGKVIKSQKIICQQLSTLVTTFQDKRYLILTDLNKKILYVTFRTSFCEDDVLKAYFHAFFIGTAISFLQFNKNLHILRRTRKNSPIYRLKNILENSVSDNTHENENNHNEGYILKAYLACEDFIEKEYLAFYNLCLENGWNMQKHLINVDDWRADWKYVPAPEKVETISKKSTMKKSVQSKYEDKPRTRSKVMQNYSSLVIS